MTVSLVEHLRSAALLSLAIFMYCCYLRQSPLILWLLPRALNRAFHCKHESTACVTETAKQIASTLELTVDTASMNRPQLKMNPKVGRSTQSSNSNKYVEYRALTQCQCFLAAAFKTS